MAHLVGAIERYLETDFALLSAEQDAAVGSGLLTFTFAASMPGAIAMQAGDKYANLNVRVERWDSRPEWVGDDWEDCDELPWAPVPGGGLLSLRGFDDAPLPEALAVDDMGPSRVQVLARGRYRYGRGEEGGLGPEALEPEDWLIRLWPEPGPSNPLAGPPRRLAGTVWLDLRPSPWQAALHGWELSGWHRTLQRLHAFEKIRWAVARVDHPFERHELEPLLDPFDWTSPLTAPYPIYAEHPLQPDQIELVARLVAATGLAAVETYGDAFECLPRLGLLAECATPAGVRFVPNPAPGPVSPVHDSRDEDRLKRKVRLWPHLNVTYLGPDIDTLLEWSSDGLATTPRRVAIRLSVPPQYVIDALRELAVVRPGAVDVDPCKIYADTAVTLRKAPRGSVV